VCHDINGNLEENRMNETAAMKSSVTWSLLYGCNPVAFLAESLGSNCQVNDLAAPQRIYLFNILVTRGSKSSSGWRPSPHSAARLEPLHHEISNGSISFSVLFLVSPSEYSRSAELDRLVPNESCVKTSWLCSEQPHWLQFMFGRLRTPRFLLPITGLRKQASRHAIIPSTHHR
jgi:hypothetical protein